MGLLALHDRPLGWVCWHDMTVMA